MGSSGLYYSDDLIILIDGWEKTQRIILSGTRPVLFPEGCTELSFNFENKVLALSFANKLAKILGIELICDSKESIIDKSSEGDIRDLLWSADGDIEWQQQN